jgi:hypothetical protein
MGKMTLVVSLLAALALSGCKKKDEAAPAAAPAPTAPEQAKPTSPPEPVKPEAVNPEAAMTGGTGKMEQKMANCPSSVPGATTTIAETADAVEVTIVGADEAAQKGIRERAMKLAEAAKTPEGEVKHDSKGTGGGGTGFCPVVLADTTIAYAEVDKGAKLTVKPNKAENLKSLAEESKRRNENLGKAPAAGGGGGAGAGIPGPGGPGSGTGGGGSK